MPRDFRHTDDTKQIAFTYKKDVLPSNVNE